MSAADTVVLAADTSHRPLTQTPTIRHSDSDDPQASGGW